jgi:hypothetical protein
MLPPTLEDGSGSAGSDTGDTAKEPGGGRSRIVAIIVNDPEAVRRNS